MNNNPQNIKELVISAVKDGIERDDFILEGSPFWFRHFNYSQDPLESFYPETPFSDESIKLFVNRQAEIKIISNYFGRAKKVPYNLHIAVIGSKGIGKKTTLKIITKIISNSFPDISYEFYNPESFYDYKSSETLSDKQLAELERKKVDIRIITCEGKNKTLFLEQIREFKKNSRIMITIWNISEYLLNQNLSINRKIFFRNYNKEDIIEIFTKRIDTFLELNDESTIYYKFIKKAVIPELAKQFQGNLRLCFNAFKRIHQQAIISNLKIPSLSLINQIIKDYVDVGTQKLTSKEQEIISYYLNSHAKAFITTSDLRDALEYDRTIAWKYLEILTKKNIFEKIKYGNPSRYRINDIYLSFFEDKIKKKIIFHDVS